jgi:hypothetical protein
MGTLAALLASQITGTIVLTAVLAAMRPHLLALPGSAVLGPAGAGFLSLVSWLTYYRALEYGRSGSSAEPRPPTGQSPRCWPCWSSANRSY